MGKVQILAVLSMDGCHISELYCKVYEELHLDRCGINGVRKHALCHITPGYSISMLDEQHKDNTRIYYPAEVTPEKADYINGLLRMHVVDEITLYTVPFIAEIGRHFFQSVLPETQWILTSQKSYPSGVCHSVYTRTEAARQPECSTFIHFQTSLIKTVY